MQIGALYEEIKTESKLSTLYNVIFMLRRLLFACMIVFSTNVPLFQIFTYLM